MDTKTPVRPRLKHAFTATAFGLVTIRNAWRAYFRQLAAYNAEQQRKGWGG